eukprot:756681-Hanusia_phi.AAC.1
MSDREFSMRRRYSCWHCSRELEEEEKKGMGGREGRSRPGRAGRRAKGGAGVGAGGGGGGGGGGGRGGGGGAGAGAGNEVRKSDQDRRWSEENHNLQRNSSCPSQLVRALCQYPLRSLRLPAVQQLRCSTLISNKSRRSYNTCCTQLLFSPPPHRS